MALSGLYYADMPLANHWLATFIYIININGDFEQLNI